VSDEREDAGELYEASMPSHLYIHVPFCASKCAYCDFASVAGASDDMVRTVFTGIRTQLKRWSLSGLSGVLDTIYVGGGTPSCHPDEVVRVLDDVHRHFVVQRDVEITAEGNPDSLDAEVVSAFGAAGATRVSVGVQSFDDRVLRLLGRRHDAAAAWQACRAVAQAGLQLSVDLMCGVPGQTITSWSETLERAVASGAQHISVYPLAVEDGTALQVAISAGLLAQPDADEAADMMLLAESTLGYHALRRYEVANYAESRRYESRHNTAYWTGMPYIGVGPGAHGMLDIETARHMGLADSNDAGAVRVRYGNAASIDDWLTGKGDSRETLTAAEAMREDVMLGMRLVRGVPQQQVDTAGLAMVLESLSADGLVELASDAVSRPGPNWRTTQRGWLLGNVVFGRIWAGE
jgi:putative oxygen-independent coproporphyrinogen III oxidase